MLSRLNFILGLLFFKITLDLSYLYLVSDKFHYLGFVLNPNMVKITESYLILIFFAIFITTPNQKIADFFYTFLLIMLVIPLLSYYGFANQSREYVYFVVISFIVLRIILNIFQKVNISIKPPSWGRECVLLITAALTITVFCLIIYQGGLSFLNFDFSKVYEYRTIAAHTIFPGKLIYLKTWMPRVFMPVLMAYTLLKRKYGLLALLLLAEGLYFGVTGNKSFLFYPLLVIGAYFLIPRINGMQLLLFALGGMVIGLTAYALITGEILWASLLVRRVFFVNAQLQFAYFHFANEFGFLYMSDSIFQGLVKYPYDFSLPHMISQYLYGHTRTACNTGYLALGYAQFGFAGMLILSIIVAIILYLCDVLCSPKLPLWFGVSVMLPSIFGLTGSQLQTALLTHGIGLALVSLWLLGSNNKILYSRGEGSLISKTKFTKI